MSHYRYQLESQIKIMLFKYELTSMHMYVNKYACILKIFSNILIGTFIVVVVFLAYRVI